MRSNKQNEDKLKAYLAVNGSPLLTPPSGNGTSEFRALRADMLNSKEDLRKVLIALFTEGWELVHVVKLPASFFGGPLIYLFEIDRSQPPISLSKRLTLDYVKRYSKN